MVTLGYTRLIACLWRSASCPFPPSAAATAAAIASTARARLRALRSVIFLFSRCAQMARAQGMAKNAMAYAACAVRRRASGGDSKRAKRLEGSGKEMDGAK